ncbi:uncharacterized protein LOC142740971 [Rhinoderma darwinii]|uniref:uncharacterized protein LOC142740971 n=1 Tax=Rhinoderma darwinii TaxID=43563 RepID=UPI003F67529A
MYSDRIFLNVPIGLYWLIIAVFFTDASTSGSMDHKARERIWRSQLDQVFNDEPSQRAFSGQGNVSETQNKYKNLLHRRMKIWWNKIFMENYIQRRLIPRGLRVQIFPSFPIDDNIFVTKWEELCNYSSFGFMELLVNLNQSMLDQLDIEIEDIQSQLNSKLTSEGLATFKNTLDEQFAEWEKDIQEIKSKKFSRDISDYAEKKVYKWRKNNFPSKFNRSISTTSLSSQSESEGVTRSRPYHSYGTRQKRKMIQKPTSNKRKPDFGESSNHLKVINLSTHTFSTPEMEVLEKGLTFSPCARFDSFSAIKDLHIFGRSLIYKKFFHRPDFDENFTTAIEKQTLSDLEDLLKEQEYDPSAI